ncbi:patatin-like phospholipase family protein [Kribbia dieselivorans]|uniref:patatin-like phospholipase family protein n=1 Tax=Kribbia dieselivorans TaxID=331526 RepID=UPI00083863D3|nr:patatin-like phospholipase family protein [Kribbia dieselivorans]
MADKVGFVLGGGGVLGASHLGMMRALLEAGISPDVIVGTSIGAFNGAYLASAPTLATVDALEHLWRTTLATGKAFRPGAWETMLNVARSRTHLLSTKVFADFVDAHLPVSTFEELEVEFQCVAASIEKAQARWFTSGALRDPILASCALPPFFAPVVIDGEHHYDGGLVDSIPLGQAVRLGASIVYVLQVGRVENPMVVPRNFAGVALATFEIARRHNFTDALAHVPDGVEVHVLPTGADETGVLTTFGHGQEDKMIARIDLAHAATQAYLTEGAPGPV